MEYLASDATNTEVEDRQRQVMKYVEDYFRQEGASGFSSKIAIGYLQVKLSTCPEKMERVISYLLNQINRRSRPVCHPLQSECPNIIPGLRGMPFWDTSDFPWVRSLEAAFPSILEEFQGMKEKGLLFQPYRAPISGRPNRSVDQHGELATDNGDWNVCYLLLHGMDACFEANRAACPQTMEIVRSIPRQYNHSFFSALAPDTHVQAHCGPTNKKLRCHLPLVVPRRINGSMPGAASESNPLCTITVGGSTRELIAGKAVIFDDSFWHEAENKAKRIGVGRVSTSIRETIKPIKGIRDDGRGNMEGSEDELGRSEHHKEYDTSTEEGPRVVLILDVWHPDLSDEEIKFLGFLDNAKMKSVKKYTESKVSGDGPTSSSASLATVGAAAAAEPSSGDSAARDQSGSLVANCSDDNNGSDGRPADVDDLHSSFVSVIMSAQHQSIDTSNVWRIPSGTTAGSVGSCGIDLLPGKE